MSVERFVHIGFPKNFSTSLQRSFFSKHPDIHYLGIGCKNDNVNYINDKITSSIEMYVRYAKEIVYQKKKDQIINWFKSEFNNAEKSNKKLVGLSAEILTATFSSNDNDIYTKASRIHEIFGSNTKIIMIVRNQLDLLKSMYHECIRNGYPLTYAKFIEYQYKYHCSSLSSDYLYDGVYEIYSRLFGQKNVLVLPFEQLRDKQTGKMVEVGNENLLIKKVSEFLEIDYSFDDFEHHNSALSPAELEAKRILNQTNPHDISSSNYDYVESHRLNPYFKSELNIEPFTKDYANVKVKRASIAAAKEMVKNDKSLSLDYSVDQEIYTKLTSLYAESNKVLQGMVNFSLAELNYPMPNE